MAEHGKGHICIYYLKTDGEDWARFLHEKLNDPTYKLQSSLVEFTDAKGDKFEHDVNIILVSPDFLNLPSLKPLAALQKQRSLAVLLGIEKREYEEFVSARGRSILTECETFISQATEKAVRNLLLRIIDLYERVNPHDIISNEAFYIDEDYDVLPSRSDIPSMVFEKKGIKCETQDSIYEEPVSTGSSRPDYAQSRSSTTSSQVSDYSRRTVESDVSRVTSQTSVSSNSVSSRIADWSKRESSQSSMENRISTGRSSTSSSRSTSQLSDYDVPPSSKSGSDVLEDYDVPSPAFGSKLKGSRRSDSSVQEKADDKSSLYRILPDYTAGKREVFVLLEKTGKGDVTVTAENGDKIKLKIQDKNVYSFNMPEKQSKFKVTKDNVALGDSEVNFESNQSTKPMTTKHTETSKLELLRTLLLEETDLICILCTALRLETKSTEALDRHLAERCDMSRSLHSLNLLLKHSIIGSTEVSSEKWPTLLHFCAEYNLIQFCEALLKLPGMVELCNTLNCDKESPKRVATKHRHSELADLIQSYIELKERDSGIDQTSPSERSVSDPIDIKAGKQWSIESCASDSRDSEYMEMDTPSTPTRCGSTTEKIKFELSLSSETDDCPVYDLPDVDTSKGEYDGEEPDSDYLPMDEPDEDVPPIPPKAHKIITRHYVNDPECFLDYCPDRRSGSMEEGEDYDVPDKDVMKHSSSDGFPTRLKRFSYSMKETSESGRSLDDHHIEDTKAGTFPDHHLPMRMRSKSVSAEKRPTKNPFKKLINHLAHTHGHDNKPEQGKKSKQSSDNASDGQFPDGRAQKNKNKSPKEDQKAMWRRKSMRIHRILEDKDIRVINLPGNAGRKEFRYDDKSLHV